MHGFGGRWSSVATNYDITLWLALGQALDPVSRELVRRPCTALPLQKVNVYQLDTKVAATAAALNLALIGAKIQDNVDDGSSLWKLADSAFGSSRAKAQSYLAENGFPVEIIGSLSEVQAEVEASAGPTLESLCTPTAKMMAAAFAHLGELLARPELSQDLARFGTSVGRFVYVWDAALDREQDQRKGQFNALDATETGDSLARAVLSQQLDDIQSGLERLPLLRQETLFRQLLSSLRSKVEKKFPLAVVGRPSRMEASKAAFLKTQDCDCCEFGCSGCCEVDFCPCGNDGCGVKCCQCCDCCDVCCCCK